MSWTRATTSTYHLDDINVFDDLHLDELGIIGRAESMDAALPEKPGDSLSRSSCYLDEAGVSGHGSPRGQSEPSSYMGGAGSYWMP